MTEKSGPEDAGATVRPVPKETHSITTYSGEYREEVGHLPRFCKNGVKSSSAMPDRC